MTSTVLLALAVFGGCTVESVEALTLVLASGSTGGWRSAFEGAVSALVVLAVLVAAVGVPLIHYVPLDVLRVVIGALLLVLGLGWLRKAVLRASGHKALHDEDAIYARTVAEVGDSAPPARGGRSAVGFAIAFKGVLLEGLEVVLIVVSLGATSHHLGLAALMAGAAALVVIGVGAALARQLREVPENTLKLGVGIMLTSFGLFWIGEGAGFTWPGSDAWILVLIAAFLVLALGMARWLARLVPREEPVTGGPEPEAAPEPITPRRRSPVAVVVAALRAFGAFWVDFLVGDAPEVFVGVLVVVGAALASRHHGAIAIPLVIVLTVGLFAATTFHGRSQPSV